MWPLPGSFYSAISWLALATSFASWIAVLVGFQAKPVKLSGRYVLIPYLQIDVILACFYSALFLLSAYGCYSTLALIDLLPYDYSGLKPRVIIAAITSLVASLSFISFVALVFISLPNRRLSRSFVDGRKLVTGTVNQATGELTEDDGGYADIDNAHA
ncbi:hypothetical protein AAVH_38719 [Aphelenchoides avenae]|nr:hypothetical protein AAVH_38719 [Aphelenchus avenae]